jgi:protein O-GlcNAc transferase
MNLNRNLIALVLLSSMGASSSCNYNVKRNDPNRLEVGDKGLVEVTVQYSKYYSEYVKASSFVQSNKLWEAISVYKDLCKVEDDSLKTYSYMGLASAYLMLNDYQKAIENYNMSVKLNDKNIDSYIGLGSAFFRLEDYKKAIEYYNKAKDINPNSPNCYWGLALAYEKLNLTERAKANAMHFIEIEPESRYRSLAEAILAK